MVERVKQLWLVYLSAMWKPSSTAKFFRLYVQCFNWIEGKDGASSYRTTRLHDGHSVYNGTAPHEIWRVNIAWAHHSVGGNDWESRRHWGTVDGLSSAGWMPMLFPPVHLAVFITGRWWPQSGQLIDYHRQSEVSREYRRCTLWCLKRYLKRKDLVLTSPCLTLLRLILTAERRGQNATSVNLYVGCWPTLWLPFAPLIVYMSVKNWADTILP